MTPKRWQQIEDIYKTAIDLPTDERTAFLTEACAEDDPLRTAVDALLTRHMQAGDFVETPPLTADLTRTELLPEADPLSGRRIGAYRLERELGRGGMGAVYLGVRADNAFQKQVAVKLIKRGMDTDFILRRFRRERQIL